MTGEESFQGNLFENNYFETPFGVAIQPNAITIYSKPNYTIDATPRKV